MDAPAAEAALIEAVYESALHPGGLAALLPRLADIFGASGATWFGFDLDTRTIGFFHAHGFDEATIAAYSGHYVMLDPGLPAVLAARPGEWLCDERAFDPRRQEHREFVHDFCFAHGIGRIGGTKLIEDDSGFAYLSFARPPGSTPFAADRHGLIDRLHPHLARAARIAARLDRAACGERLGRAVLDRLHAAACVVDARRRVLYANAAAERLFGGGEMLRIVAGRLVGLDSTTAARLERAVAAACARCPASGGLSWWSTVGGERIQVQVAPLAAAHPLGALANGPAALVLASAPGPQAHAVCRLQQVFDLTGAEARVLAALGSGETVEEIATRTEVAVATVRTQLRSIYAKLGVHTQAQAVAAAGVLPALASSLRR